MPAQRCRHSRYLLLPHQMSQALTDWRGGPERWLGMEHLPCRDGLRGQLLFSPWGKKALRDPTAAPRTCAGVREKTEPEPGSSQGYMVGGWGTMGKGDTKVVWIGDEEKLLLEPAKQEHRLPRRVVQSPEPWRFSRPKKKKPWAITSKPPADSAFSRKLDKRPPEAPCNQNYEPLQSYLQESLFTR